MAGLAVRHGSKLRVPQFAAQLRSAPCLRKSRTHRPKPDFISSIFVWLSSSFFVIHPPAEPLTEVIAILSARDHRRFLRRPAPPLPPARIPSGRVWSPP